MACRYPDAYPKALESGKGGHVLDVEGREYIDLIAGLGAISVGYCDDEVDLAVQKQLCKGVLFSLPNMLEAEAAKKLTKLVPWTEMWKFGKNGTDGTVMAVRAARAYTGRTKILTAGYNGCADQFEIKGTRNAGIPKELNSTIQKFVYLNPVTITDEYACVLMEPMVNEYPEKGYLESIREACNETGTLLIFDEVVTGGRFEGFTAHNYFKVVPDLCVLSKGIANGLPLSAVGGKRSIMATFERDDFFASGTFGAECLSLAAFMAAQDVLCKSISKMVWNGSRIKEAFNKLEWPDGTECVGYPTRLTFVFPTDAHKYLFWQEMCKRGVLVGYTNFIMASHTDEDVTNVIRAMFESHKILKSAWSNPSDHLIGPLPIAALRK